MIFFGTRLKPLAESPFQEPCSHCGQSNQTLSLFWGYFHIYWIPFIPTGKELALTCNHCKVTILEKEMPPGLKTRLSGEKKDTVCPFTHGLVWH